MNKFDPSLEEKLTALLIYMLFKKPEGLDAFYIADRFGMNLRDSDDSLEESTDADEPLKSWIRLGGKVNFAWLENHGALEYLTMGQHQFEHLRYKDQDLYTEMKAIRDKSNKRWSNDWKRIQPKIFASRSLMNVKPRDDVLNLTWQSMMSSCARKLQQLNMQTEAKKTLELSFEDLTIGPKNHQT